MTTSPAAGGGAVVDALREMVRGATMLKAGRSGKPHFRHFELAPDLQSIRWESPKKADAAVPIKAIRDLLKGQQTKVFLQNPIPEHRDLSFSVLYGNDGRTLDVVCKDRTEFELWTMGIRALMRNEVTPEMTAQIKTMAADDDADGAGTDRVRVVVDRGTTKMLVREDASDVYSFGEGKNGKLGHGDDVDEFIPRIIEALLGRDVIALACGSGHAIAITDSGEVYSWGFGNAGQLGNGKERSRFTPLAIAGLRGNYVTQVAAGELHSAAISDSGLVYTWGSGDDGRLGFVQDNGRIQSTPQLVDSSPWEGKRITQVACGAAFTTVVIEDGRLFSFGLNHAGQLGVGDLESHVGPQRVQGLDLVEIRRVACGNAHVAAITDNGQLYVWGDGTRGQLGLGDDVLAVILKPRLLESFKGQEIIDVACGLHHTLVLTANGTMLAFGDGSAGQLGIGAAIKMAAVPKVVTFPDNRKMTMVSCGDFHSAAVSDSGQVFTWGLGANGRLGHELAKDKMSPSLLEPMAAKQTRLIVCGGAHTIAAVTHGWVPDKEAKDCMACKKRFTQVRRRHHCRRCGGVFCGSCSSKRFPLLEAGFSEPVRVCDKCHSLLCAAAGTM